MSRIIELSGDAAAVLRAEIARAHGNEVCFLATLDDAGSVQAPRVVARGHARAVLAATGDAEPGSLAIHNHPSGDVTPSDVDLAVAAQLYARGVGLAIVDNSASELYVVVDPGSAPSLQPLDAADVSALLAPGGALSRAHPVYEDRPAQREMAEAVVSAYNNGGIALAEAGTGIGKSIAYLVPAILWSSRNRERTVVSTNTINLQEQLIGKDLPFLRRMLGVPFRFALVKGRHNYVSIRRARLAAQGQETLFDDGQRAELSALMAWLESTREGSRQDLPFEPAPELWDEVVSDSDVCMRARCPHFEACFYQRARRDAAAADVLVVNHHLLFSDLAVRRSQGNYTASAVLPPYRRLILDEAHNLEDAATSHLGATLSRRGVLRVLGRLDRRGHGILGIIEYRLLAEQGAGDLLREDVLRTVAADLRPRVERGRQLATDLFERLDAFTAATEDGVVRLVDGFLQDLQETAGPVIEGLLLVLDELARGVARLREELSLDRSWAESLTQERVELQGMEARLRETGAALRTVFPAEADEFPLVRWLERRGASREAGTTARAAPVALARMLHDSLFECMDTSVLTSATLTTGDGFGFMRARLGLHGGLRVRESRHPSPFDYGTRTIVAVPTDVPDPREPGDRYHSVVAAVTEDLARSSGGGLFVLFTSYRAMRAVAAELRRRGAPGRWPLLVQGEAPRTRLLDRFRDVRDGVLLGVASFWEGVDVPGEPLRGLVLAKLPFRVPTEPLTAARMEAIEEEGGNGFTDYMLPLAALRLKQGFGRLIRTRTDRGAVVILDRRIRARGYGRYFLDALPGPPVRVAPWSELRDSLRQFYTGIA